MVGVCHILFIHSSVNGIWVVCTFCCYKYAAVNTCVGVFEWACFRVLGVVPRNGILGCVVAPCVTYCRIAILFFQSSYCPAIWEGYSFSTSFPMLHSSFYFSCPTVLKWYLMVVLIFIFQMTVDVEHLFMCLQAIYLCSFFDVAVCAHTLML